MLAGITCGYVSLVTSLIAVACTQLDKLKTAILDIRQQHITHHRGQEDEHYNAGANCIMQAKLNANIQLHQSIIE